ncbi:hypothetical protein ACOMHN_000107 [Nucella lapillus]
MTVCCFNAESISRKRNKRVEIENVIRDESIDIMFITETWLKPQGDEAACVDVTPGGYSMRSFPRQARRGGWIAFITRKSLFEHATVTTKFPFDHNSFELVQLTLDGHHCVNFFCLYRPRPSKVNKLTDGMFFEEFSELLEHANVMGGKTLFLGDFNISWDRPAHPNTVKAIDLLDMFPCPRREEEPVMCYLDIAKPASTPVFQTVRNLRAIDKSQFRADVAAVFHNQPPATVEQLEAHLRAVLDVHAPAIRRLQTQRRSSPWKQNTVSCVLQEVGNSTQYPVCYRKQHSVSCVLQEAGSSTQYPVCYRKQHSEVGNSTQYPVCYRKQHSVSSVLQEAGNRTWYPVCYRRQETALSILCATGGVTLCRDVRCHSHHGFLVLVSRCAVTSGVTPCRDVRCHSVS